MTTLLAIVGLAALFVVFGVYRPGVRGGCSNCTCDEDSCRLEDDPAAGSRSV